MADDRSFFDDFGTVRDFIADIGVQPDRFNAEVKTYPRREIHIRCDCRKFTDKEIKSLDEALRKKPFKMRWYEGYIEISKMFTWEIETYAGQNISHSDFEMSDACTIKFTLSHFGMMKRSDQPCND